LPKAFDEAQFEFNSKALRGVEKQRDRWKCGFMVVDGAIGEGLGQIYVRKHFPPEIKVKMDSLVVNLCAVLKQWFATLVWMDDMMCVEAVKKLNTFKPHIGYPNK